ncbi:MAG TPA: helix-turn-helix transcriptional regulator [Clostridiales bacterium]|nr:helix-turn-helix transcriptional regulator [Clostridiales bacterium]
MNNDVKISLRAARINAGLSQKEAADRLLIGTSTLQGYESGRRIPRWDLIQKMQEVYNIDCRHLKLTDS